MTKGLIFDIAHAIEVVLSWLAKFNNSAVEEQINTSEGVIEIECYSVKTYFSNNAKYFITFFVLHWDKLTLFEHFVVEFTIHHKNRFFEFDNSFRIF